MQLIKTSASIEARNVAQTTENQLIMDYQQIIIANPDNQMVQMSATLAALALQAKVSYGSSYPGAQAAYTALYESSNGGTRLPADLSLLTNGMTIAKKSPNVSSATEGGNASIGLSPAFLSKVQNVLSPAEQALVNGAGGIQALLDTLPVSPQELAQEITAKGPAEALSGILPQTPQGGSLLDPFLKALEENPNAIPDLIKKQVQASSDTSSNLMPLLTAKVGESSSVFEKNQSKPEFKREAKKEGLLSKVQDTFGVHGSMPGVSQTKLDPIWHKNTELNLFQIVSQTTVRFSSRVSAER
jgi:hypothetical protein